MMLRDNGFSIIDLPEYDLGLDIQQELSKDDDFEPFFEDEEECVELELTGVWGDCNEVFENHGWVKGYDY